MTSALGIGMTHYPMLAGTDQQMAGLLSLTLTDPDIPAEAKDPAGWSPSMRAAWSDDRGAAAAAAHRRALLDGLTRLRAELDEFAPDVVVVWGDDQYENFREEVVPPFCVLAYDDLDVDPFGAMTDLGLDNYWGRPADSTSITLHGDSSLARQVTREVIEDGFELAYSYRKRETTHFPHSILNTQIFLDYENYGAKFPYTILPITVNCYGEHAIARKGGVARFADIAGEKLDPPGPTPARCLDFGAAVARATQATGKRVAYVASSSWSHAFLNDKDWHLRPDTEADRRLYAALVDGDIEAWRAMSSKQIVDAGEHEMLNWFCLLGAMNELGLDLTWSTFVETEIFNSNKCFALYRGGSSVAER